MSKYIIAILLLLATSAAFCQKKSKVILISSSRSEGIKLNGVDVIKVYDGQWRQDFSTMRSDSAYFYQSQNAFDAFGHVVIHQGDTLNIYSDKLHYDGNTKVADLTDNVVMIDKEARLTTDHFSYNTATRIGTYIQGGKIVDKTNTLTSTNGYYFAGSHDAYFRYNVVCVTTDARIITDTMRYNSQSKINYFYGPTHIYGQKDKDTLDTDFGTYDTNTEQAFFTKNNMYRQGTKSLKGDTLFYDRLKGFGRAVKHVIFNDNEQKVTIHGGLGTYQKSNDLTIVTRDPYIVMLAEETDTTKNDSLKKAAQLKTTDSLSKINSAKNTKGNKKSKKDIQSLVPPLNTMPMNIKMPDSVSKRLTMPVIDSFSKKMPRVNTDSLIKNVQAQAKKIDKVTQNKIKAVVKGVVGARADTGKLLSKIRPAAKKDTGNIKRDSIYMSADTIETRILTFKELNTIQEQERLSHIKDSTKKITVMLKKAPKYISVAPPSWPRDTSYYHRLYFGPPKPKPQKKKAAIKASAPKKPTKADSVFYTPKVVLNDTAHVRIIYAFHSAKIFKSDLQAIADSIFYSNSDSTIRCYTKPMMWTQGSQLSGDTINLHLHNKKLDKMDMFPNAFIANVEKFDSTHFNQTGGKKMRGFFKNDKLQKVYIDGNAETIYFERDSTTKQITDMERSFSSRLWVFFKNNEVDRTGFITKPELRYIPIHAVKEDEKVLKGFIWKPKDRPVSKESILPSYNKKMKADTTKKTRTGVSSAKKSAGSKVSKGGGVKAPGGQKALTDTAKSSTTIDTAKNKLTNKLPGLKTKTDSVIKTTLGNDSLKITLPAGTPAKKDTTKKPVQ